MSNLTALQKAFIDQVTAKIAADASSGEDILHRTLAIEKLTQGASFEATLGSIVASYMDAAGAQFADNMGDSQASFNTAVGVIEATIVSAVEEAGLSTNEANSLLEASNTVLTSTLATLRAVYQDELSVVEELQVIAPLMPVTGNNVGTNRNEFVIARPVSIYDEVSQTTYSLWGDYNLGARGTSNPLDCALVSTDPDGLYQVIDSNLYAEGWFRENDVYGISYIKPLASSDVSMVGLNLSADRKTLRFSATPDNSRSTTDSLFTVYYDTVGKCWVGVEDGTSGGVANPIVKIYSTSVDHWDLSDASTGMTDQAAFDAWITAQNAITADRFIADPWVGAVDGTFNVLTTYSYNATPPSYSKFRGGHTYAHWFGGSSADYGMRLNQLDTHYFRHLDGTLEQLEFVWKGSKNDGVNSYGLRAYSANNYSYQGKNVILTMQVRLSDRTKLNRTVRVTLFQESETYAHSSYPQYIRVAALMGYNPYCSNMLCGQTHYSMTPWNQTSYSSFNILGYSK